MHLLYSSTAVHNWKLNLIRVVVPTNSMQINQLMINLLGHPMNNNKKILGVGAIAVVAAIMIAASTVSMDDVYAKKRYSQGDSQSSASANECGPKGGQSVNTFSTNCLNDPDQIQDSDGAAVISNPSQNSNATN